MSLTFAQANDELLAAVKAAFDSLSGTNDIFWESVKGDRSDSDTPFFQVFVRHRTGRNAGFPSANNQAMYRREGDVTIQCFHPVGRGLSSSYADAKVFADAFEGQATSGGIWFRNTRINEIGKDGQFYQLNVVTEFNYDEIK